MKHLRKLLVVMIAFVFAFGTSVTAFAQEVPSGAGGNATITIENAAKGETYKVVKLFDAAITDPPSDAITYTGTIPTALANFFEKDTAGNITLKKIADPSGKNPGDPGYVDTYYQMTPDDFAAMKTWADGISAGDATYPSYTAVSDGGELKFTGLKYGYYVICSTQGTLVTVDSTNKDVTVIDKNPTKPSAEKTVAPEHVSVGQTVTYTATFGTANYLNNPTSGKPEQIVSYIIEDTLPAFLGDVTVTSFTIGGTAVTPTPQFDNDKKIEIPWVNETVPTQDHKYTSKYDNAAEIVVTYTATVTADADVGKGNVNTISLKPQVDRGDGKVPYQERDEWNDNATIYTHAAALQKKAGSEDGDNLKGAEFSFNGLIVSGVPGFYTVVSYDPTSTTPGTVMKCDNNGKLVIAGIDADTTTPVVLVGTETKAPEGYNQLAGTFNLTTTVMSAETTTVHGERTTYYDADGNIVDTEEESTSSLTRNEITSFTDIPAANIQKIVNKTGTELPETGGIGTTMFYIFGGLLVVGAGIVLVSRNRKVSE